jgi:DNA-binding IclR family transcriptional regulator
MKEDNNEIKDNGASGLIVSISRALSLLEILADSEAGLSLSEIARRLKVNKQIATRIIQTVESCNYIYASPNGNGYFLSYKLSNLGLRKLAQTGILDPASSVIRSLANEIGELIRLAVVEGSSINWVLAAVGQKRTLYIDPNYSLEVELHSTATGRAWLATLPFETALQYILRNGVTPFTKHTLTSIDALRQELDETRKRGWAISYEETELGVGAVAAAIVLPKHGRCVGTISLAAPINRMNRRDLEAAAPLVVAATERLAQMWPRGTAQETGQLGKMRLA